jgi:hypothetical protein
VTAVANKARKEVVAMTLFTIGVGGFVEIDVRAKTDRQARRIVEKLCAGKLPANLKAELDANEVRSVESLHMADVFGVWPQADSEPE